MAFTPLRPGPERIAARIVHQVTGAAIQPQDGVTGRELQHDFDAILPRQDPIAIEVTSAADEDRLALQAGLQRQGTVVQRTSGPSWSVDLQPDASVRDVRSTVVDVVDALDTEGVDLFSCSIWEDPPGSAPYVRAGEAEQEAWTPGTRRAVEIGLHAGLVINHSPDYPVIVLGRPGAGATSDPDPIVEAVEIAAAANEKKLTLSKGEGYAERHLFLWIDGSRWDLEFAHQRAAVTDARRPDLPSAVTDVWVGSYRSVPAPMGNVEVWRFDANRGWWAESVDSRVMG